MAGDLIAAIATAPGPAAIGAVRLSGEGAARRAGAVFRPADGKALEAHQPKTLVYGTLLDREGKSIDKALATWSEAGRSYTGEETAELQCHGSPMVLAMALEALFAQGGPGSLQLPGQEPFWAVMDSLKLLGEPGKDLVKYGFGFTEHKAGEAYRGQGVHKAAAGESLWDYAWRYGWDMEALRRANPHIRDIADLREGEEVRSP